MRGINSFKFAFCVLGVLPVSVTRGGPATQPVPNDAVPTVAPVVTDVDVPIAPGDVNSGTSSIDGSKPRRIGDRGVDRGVEGGLGNRARFGQRGGGNNVTPADIEEAMKFMKDHSHNRLAAIESMPDSDRKTRFKEISTRNFLSWDSIRLADPELYQVVVKRVELEDNVFGLTVQWHKDTAEEKPDTQAKLRDEVGKLVDVGIQERQMRLDRLAKTVEDQQKILTTDKGNRDNLVEDRLKSVLGDSKGLFSGPNNGGGPAHNHGGPPHQPG